MTDPDLENLKSFYGRINRKTMPPEPVMFVEDLSVSVEVLEAYHEKDVQFCLATHSFFEADRQRYYLEELHTAKQEEARVHIYLGSFTGQEWPEDFETDEEANE